MQGTSAAVRSNQQGLHGGLARAVRRHGASVWRKPARPADAAALARLDQALAAHRGQLILDSFCGTGMSGAIAARPGALSAVSESLAQSRAAFPSHPWPRGLSAAPRTRRAPGAAQ